ncbi:MAG: amidohydrolase family protein [Lentisphaeria bacterium]|jgi:predicted TIM-barrel fold metal-dependent hydrolase|nr:amidohydrolase family protein [Lentisphaeria bacterium]
MKHHVIDVHNHPNWHGHNLAALVRNMDEHGIEKTWLLGWELPRQEYDQACPGYYVHMDPRGIGAALDLVVQGLERYPDRFIGGWAPDPRDRYARARLEAAVKIHGIRVYGELKCRMRYDDPDAIAMYRFCGELGLPVLFHLQCDPHTVAKQAAKRDNWLEWYGGDLAVVDTICELCPDTRFIGHGPGFWREISGDADATDAGYPSGPVTPDGHLVQVLRRRANLYCDLSAGSGCNALARDLAHARAFVHEFQDRILFGRDYFDARQFETLDKLGLSPETEAKIYRDNALRLVPA